MHDHKMWGVRGVLTIPLEAPRGQKTGVAGAHARPLSERFPVFDFYFF